MYISIQCAGMPIDPQNFEDKNLGGSETAAYMLAKQLAAREHQVTLFCHCEREMVHDKVKYIPLGPMTPQHPMGESFEFYSRQTPVDVLIAQRQPDAFSRDFNSKLNFWWTHDLALHKLKTAWVAQSWNVDGIFTVSEWHKQQLMDIYRVKEELVFPINNGHDLVDPGDVIIHRMTDTRPGPGPAHTLLYSSRPERGLAHLVRQGGIMEKLQEAGDGSHLFVCGYDNTVPQMRALYEHLWQRCEELSNVTNLGNLSKRELAAAWQLTDTWLYPTEFEEVSCITAMEALRSDVQIITSKHGALPETLKGSGAVLIPLNADGEADEPRFLAKYFEMRGWNVATRNERLRKNAARGQDFTWDHVASNVMDAIHQKMSTSRHSHGAILHQLSLESDVYTSIDYAEQLTGAPRDRVATRRAADLHELYGHVYNGEFERLNERIYDREWNVKKVEHIGEDLTKEMRYLQVEQLVAKALEGRASARVLDYGCAHGHYTLHLAKRFPQATFHGVDLNAINIEKAREWQAQEKLENVEFWTVEAYEWREDFDVVVCAEVLEHVQEPFTLANHLESVTVDGGSVIITTPVGPWEAEGFRSQHPWRDHVRHYDRAMLNEVWGEREGFHVNLITGGPVGRYGQKLGNYVASWVRRVSDRPVAPDEHAINTRKVSQLCPRGTVGLHCMVKNGADQLVRMLNSCAEVIQEAVIGIDKTTADNTREVVERWAADNPLIAVKVVDTPSPLEVGFDEARNVALAECEADWVLWLDHDEELVNARNIFKFTKTTTQYDGYMVGQHHFSCQPLGLLKTDWPVRLFKNHNGVKFIGVVHEHPEQEMNKGVGYALPVRDIEIAHASYITEEVRRARFQRNIPLMVRDREKYPERELGKFLWIRDLVQMTQFTLEQNGMTVTPQIRGWCADAVKMYQEVFLQKGRFRMAKDGLEYYTNANNVLQQGFNASFELSVDRFQGDNSLTPGEAVQGRFANVEDLHAIFKILLEERLGDYGKKYF